MSYTLITSLGMGMYKSGYDQTVYNFPDGKSLKTKCFLEALLKTNYRDIKDIIFIGTATSSWDILVEEKPDLWERVLTATSDNSLSDDLINEIETFICKEYSLESVKIKIHTASISDETSLEVFDVYCSLIPEIKESSDILFDITHGFRTMPILLYQALQFSLANNVLRNFELVYGERNHETKTANVRNISSYWRYAQISDAIYLFENKLDGIKLAQLLQTEWPEGSKCIKKLSELIHSNFSQQIVDCMLNIKNVLQNTSFENKPSYILKIKSFFENFVKLYNNNSKALTLKNLAEFLESKSLHTQAIITLQIAVETGLAESINDKDAIGDYDWWKDNRQRIRKELLQDCYKHSSPDFKLRENLDALENIRNQIAHGGAKGKNTGFPAPENIHNRYEKGLKGAESILKRMGISQ